METIKSEIQFYIRQLDRFENERLDELDEQIYQKVKALFGITPKLALLDRIQQDYKTYYNNIVRSDLPMALAEAGLSTAVTDDGVEVYTKTEYTTKTLDKGLVSSWLEENGYGAIIKDSLMLEKGGFTPQLEETLSSLGVSYTRDSAINGAQLKATVKNHMEHGGDAPPKAAMAVEVFTEAKIKRPKAGF
jgi:hypothetical protein